MEHFDKMKGRSDVLRDWAGELEAWRERFEHEISQGAVWSDQCESWPIVIIANGLRRMADSIDPNNFGPDDARGDAGAVIFERRDVEQRFAAAHDGPDRRGGES